MGILLGLNVSKRGMVAIAMSERVREACPKCGSWSIVGSCDVASIFKKRGLNIVRKRGVKFAIVDWICESCGHKWSARICISGVRFRRRMSARDREALELQDKLRRWGEA